ncbi:MAG: hypothetical protein NT167_27380 [Verrucomicrobia bacterium]|nr:hypothetical protein [Verrucomicrobiota bacterium]
MPSQQQKLVERLVDRILVAKPRDAGADVSALEREKDELVYARYGLTSERFMNLTRMKGSKTGNGGSRV